LIIVGTCQYISDVSVSIVNIVGTCQYISDVSVSLVNIVGTCRYISDVSVPIVGTYQGANNLSLSYRLQRKNTWLLLPQLALNYETLSLETCLLLLKATPHRCVILQEHEYRD
jgi:hypothetical protein